MKTYELSLLVDADQADELLAEIRDDPRVRAATLHVGDGKYRIAVPDAELADEIAD